VFGPGRPSKMHAGKVRTGAYPRAEQLKGGLLG